MLYIANPDYSDYEMITKIVILADSEKEALKFAEKEANKVNEFLAVDRTQEWSVEIITNKENGVLLSMNQW